MVEEVERIFVIPLKKIGLKSSKAAPTAVKLVKSFLTRNMKVETENILIDDPTAIVVYVNHPGNSIAMWYSENKLQQNYYYDLQEIYNAVEGYDYNLKAIFWYQGEADRLYYNSYRNRFYQLMFGFANGLYDYDFNIYIVIVSLNIGNNGYDNIRRVQIQIANEHPKIYSVDSWGYLKRDWVHLTDESYMLLGKEIYNMFRLTIE